MKLPFVSRARYSEMSELKQFIIESQRTRYAELEAAHKRLLDLIMKGNFGVQLYDTLPEAQPAGEPEPTPEEKVEEEFSEEIAEIKSIMRTRPSQLGAYMSRLLDRQTIQRASAAHPAKQMFAQARQEVGK